MLDIGIACIKAGSEHVNVLSLESTRERYTTFYLVINQTNHANIQPVVECPRVKQPPIKSASSLSRSSEYFSESAKCPRAKLERIYSV